MKWGWVILAVVAALMMLFPPFHAQLGVGEAINRGYHFLFTPPTMTDSPTVSVLATVNVPLLIVQYLALGMIALFAWLARQAPDTG